MPRNALPGEKSLPGAIHLDERSPVAVRIMGLDPGTASLGVAFLEIASSRKYICLHYSCLHTTKLQPLEKRLLEHYEKLRELIHIYQPDVLACEELYFNKNVRTALSVGAAIGVIFLLGGQENLPIYTYSPLQVKMAVVGYGRATKEQIQDTLKLLLELQETPRPDDAADALAVALCHAYASRWQSLIRENAHD